MTKAFDHAMRLLNRREHSTLELFNKLKKNGFNSSEIQQALHHCQELGLQSDSRFVDSYTRWRIRQGYGPLKISYELAGKGITKNLIQETLEQEQNNWFYYALEVWQKKAKGQDDLSLEMLQKQQRFLLYRGFSMDIISLVVKEIKRLSRLE